MGSVSVADSAPDCCNEGEEEVVEGEMEGVLEGRTAMPDTAAARVALVPAVEESTRARGRSICDIRE